MVRTLLPPVIGATRRPKSIVLKPGSPQLMTNTERDEVRERTDRGVDAGLHRSREEEVIRLVRERVFRELRGRLALDDYARSDQRDLEPRAYESSCHPGFHRRRRILLPVRRRAWLARRRSR